MRFIMKHAQDKTPQKRSHITKSVENVVTVPNPSDNKSSVTVTDDKKENKDKKTKKTNEYSRKDSVSKKDTKQGQTRI